MGKQMKARINVYFTSPLNRINRGWKEAGAFVRGHAVSFTYIQNYFWPRLAFQQGLVQTLRF